MHPDSGASAAVITRNHPVTRNSESRQLDGDHLARRFRAGCRDLRPAALKDIKGTSGRHACMVRQETGRPASVVGLIRFAYRTRGCRASVVLGSSQVEAAEARPGRRADERTYPDSGMLHDDRQPRQPVPERKVVRSRAESIIGSP
jgi:hypothetical protein